jgi:MoxR-like ATPase
MEENTTTLDIRAINEKIERESAFIDLLTMEMKLLGQKHMVERLLIGL